MYIIDWLKGRIGTKKVNEYEELKKYPAPSEYEIFDSATIYGFKLLSQMDIRSFLLAENNSWAMKITEPDNRAEFKNGERDDAEEIHGRSFVTNIALHKGEEEVTLAVQIICKEPVTNKRDAISFRPAFINTMYRDTDLKIVETGVDRTFTFDYEIVDEQFNGKPIVVNQDNYKKFRDGLLLNNRRQMPIVICPDTVYKYTYPTHKQVDGKGTIANIAKSLMGYAHVVIVDKDITKKIFSYNEGKFFEYHDVLQDDYVIFHTGFDENGLPDQPVYCSVYVEDEQENEEETLQDVLDEPNALVVMSELAKKYSVRKQFKFEPALFYRMLKKEYYKYAGKNDTAAAIVNLEQEISELKEQIIDLQSENERAAKESKSRIDELKSKFQLSQNSYMEYKEKAQNSELLLKDYKIQMEKQKKEHENKLRQKEIMIQMLTGGKLPEPPDNRKTSFYSENGLGVLLSYESAKNDSLLLMIMYKEITNILNKVYLTLREEQRRYEILEIVLQYNEFIRGNQYEISEILYYPKSLELYPGEFRDVVLDVLFAVSDNNEIAEALLEANEFDYVQDDKKKEVMAKLNGYRQHQTIKGIIEKTGFQLKSSSNHYIYSYYGDERYKITVSGSPQDINSGKNLANRIIELCL